MKRISTRELERRGYRFGTPAECWEALRILSDAIKHGKKVSEDVALWFSKAVDSNTGKNAKALARDLGFVERGAARKFNPHDINNHMVELINEGLTKAEASRVCASAYGCHPETALLWFRKGIGNAKD